MHPKQNNSCLYPNWGRENQVKQPRFFKVDVHFCLHQKHTPKKDFALIDSQNSFEKKPNNTFQSLWNYDIKNHTENVCDTEKTQKLHWKIFTKEITVIIQDYLTEIFFFVVKGHLNHTEKF